MTNRLRFAGTFGMEMTPESLKFFKEAAEEAKASKLGSPLQKR